MEIGISLILDTNAVSAFADGDMDLLEIIALAPQLSLPVIVLGEYRFGIAASRNAAGYRQWLGELVERCRVLEISEVTTHHYAEIRVALNKAGTPIPVNDAWIAALARQHDLPIISRDRHFDVVPSLRRISW